MLCSSLPRQPRTCCVALERTPFWRCPCPCPTRPHPCRPQLSLHTLWKHGDGSPAFFAAASELYTVAAAARDANADAAAAAVESSGLPLDDVLSPASISRSSQVGSPADAGDCRRGKAVSRKWRCE